MGNVQAGRRTFGESLEAANEKEERTFHKWRCRLRCGKAELPSTEVPALLDEEEACTLGKTAATKRAPKPSKKRAALRMGQASTRSFRTLQSRRPGPFTLA
eukprot:GHVT01101453.1.p3 GENE.GHVT01101453.1~~GHVT01101453.1.p3  ORF type:complete len:101 (+),score=16.56 GHVT01101453.1:472-774(+)